MIGIGFARSALRSPLSRISKPHARSFHSPVTIKHPFSHSHNLRAFFSSPTRNISQIASSAPISTVPKSLPIWLLSCSGLVLGILVIGGLTRLTESGLSITEWQPITGILPPLTQADWDVEWEKYRVSPEGVLTNSRIEMSEFKKIFYMEWAHRIGGRVLGIAFIAPTIYYLSRYRLPRPIPAKLMLIGIGIGAQGVIGWYMVKSGLEQEIIDTKAHLTAALLLYIGMLHTALGLRRDIKLSGGNDALWSAPAVRRYRGLVGLAGGMVLFTAVSGAFVAGLDAGLVYNEFPTMGGRLVPSTEELLDIRYAKRPDGGDRWWRNMLENPVTAQFDHRLFATTTFSVLLTLPFVARLPSLRAALPGATKRLADLTAAAAVAQVTMGITTLLYLVPVPLAAMHQAGSVVLLTCLIGLGTSLRRPGRLAARLKGVAKGLRVESL